jgi:predicted metal-dependent hydrolase
VSALTPEGLEAFRRGLLLYRIRAFHEAHREWEALWRTSGGPIKECFQALILLAGAGHHLQQGRGGAARTLLARATAKLHACESCPELNLPPRLARVAERAARTDALTIPPVPLSDP